LHAIEFEIAFFQEVLRNRANLVVARDAKNLTGTPDEPDVELSLTAI